jgi:hypothetical protein
MTKEFQELVLQFKHSDVLKLKKKVVNRGGGGKKATALAL